MENQTITERVKSFADACEVLQLDPAKVLPYAEDTTDPEEINDNAFKKLKIIVKALNEGWKPVYDGTQWHYWPVFRHNNAGFGFSGTYYVAWGTSAFVGSRLEFKSRELSDYAGKQFIEIYNQFLN